jgi:hypothetical protein
MWRASGLVFFGSQRSSQLSVKGLRGAPEKPCRGGVLSAAEVSAVRLSAPLPRWPWVWRFPGAPPGDPPRIQRSTAGLRRTTRSNEACNPSEEYRRMDEPLKPPGKHGGASERRFPPPWSVDEGDACFIGCSSRAKRTARSISLSLKLRPSRTSATTRRRNVPRAGWQQIGGLSDVAKLTVRYRESWPLFESVTQFTRRAMRSHGKPHRPWPPCGLGAFSRPWRGHSPPRARRLFKKGCPRCVIFVAGWSSAACIAGMKEVCPAPLLLVSASTLMRQSRLRTAYGS